MALAVVLGVTVATLSTTKGAAPGPATPGAGGASASLGTSRVAIAYDANASEAFKPQLDAVRRLAAMALTNFAKTGTTRAAWKKYLSTNDTVGLKVHCSPGADTGTRPAVVAAFVEQLLDFGLRPDHIVIWDRQRGDLRRAGFYDLAEKYGVRVEGSVNTGYDTNTFYNPDQPIVGTLVWTDVEFGRKDSTAGRKSYVSKLVSRELTKIVVITPLLNHNTAGVLGNLYSLAMGSVDNTLRFENDLLHLKSAVPEIYALPSLSDHVALCITDALICQYEGEQLGLLHYSAALNEIRLSNDPVALDVLSLRELDRQRKLSEHPVSRAHPIAAQMELLENAALLDLGNVDESRIKTELSR